jgi:hypothetical protein
VRLLLPVEVSSEAPMGFDDYPVRVRKNGKKGEPLRAGIEYVARIINWYTLVGLDSTRLMREKTCDGTSMTTCIRRASAPAGAEASY